MATTGQGGIEVVTKGFKSDENDAVLCNENIEIKFDSKTLHLAQSWKNGEELAPIFSGGCWAGTVVWQAALDLCNYMSEHLREELVGATVVELGCGIGVPGMIARVLGATVVLTEQDELISLLEQNLKVNFPGDDGIRWTALDWERKADAEGLLASCGPDARLESPLPLTLPAQEVQARQGEHRDSSCLLRQQQLQQQQGRLDKVYGEGCKEGSRNAYSGERCTRNDSTQMAEPSAIGTPQITTSASTYTSTDRSRGRLDFILCADCVFEPLYGDSWKALAKVMDRLSDLNTTVLTSVERRGEEDGVSSFIEECRTAGFATRMVFRATPDAAAPVELYEFSKGGDAHIRGADILL